MSGMNNTTGRVIPDEITHIQQSVADILMTPVGTRLMRREYGSFIPDLIDQPLNGATLLRVYAAAVMALLRWEPRIKIEKISAMVNTATPSSLLLDFSGLRVGGEPLAFSVPLRTGGFV